jgi:uncharacterized protein YbjT (DUF2867 family)
MKVILFGASGNLGQKVAHELFSKGFDLTVVIRNQSKAMLFEPLKPKIIIANPLEKHTLKQICEGNNVVISTFGKSVSLKDFSKESFHQVDFIGNQNILNEAITSGIQKFIYVSALGAENYPKLNYFKAHHDFTKLLISSGLDYCIVKPPAIFSAYQELIEMAKRGVLVNMGSGQYRTNPIFEGDLSKIIVNSINENDKNIEAGGKFMYTRIQILEIIKARINQNTSIINMPKNFVNFFLFFLCVFNQNAHDKLAFISEVMNEDIIAPTIGEMSFESYVEKFVQ